jgi:dolichol-phosphate mannosyltransferase
LVKRVDAVRASAGLNLDLLLIDDDSRDGTSELVESLGVSWLNIVVRTSERGLSQAVLDGLQRSKTDVLIVMDADLSHPPEKIPEMIDALDHGADMVVGSRFVEGGSTDDEWGIFRWLNSRAATLLAMPLTRLKDPMSGFLAMRRSTFSAGRDFNPVGYKIGLELLIKCHCQRVVEIPIHFCDRRLGKSKLSIREQLKYLQHLRRLYVYKYGTWSHLAQFLAIGLSGALVNVVLLTLFLALGVGANPAIALSIWLSMVWNFFLNRRFSFSYARGQSVLWQFVGFVAACSVGALVNFCVTVAVWPLFQYKQVAAILGIVGGVAFNFVASRFVVFRQRHVRRPNADPGPAPAAWRG